MGAAFALSASRRVAEQARILKLRQKLWHSIESIPGVCLNGSVEQRIAGNLNVTFSQFSGENLLISLEPLAVSNTSACASASSQPSYVLKALGLNDEQAYRSVRLSIGRFTTEEEIDRAIEVIWKRTCGKINK
jgi:cysteine desulfurase